MIVETIKQDLMGLVSGHDYSYMMSDSHDVWVAGMRVDKEIQAKIHALIAIHREDSEALYSEVKGIAGSDYTDYDEYGNGLKYRVINNWFKPYMDEVNTKQLD
jgi:hypothetical protein